MRALVGYTGFVGSNIADKHRFDALYNSGNIETAFGTSPDLLVYAGVPAGMFLANSNPASDLAVIENAAENIRKIAPKHLALISTIAVLDNPIGTDESCVIDTEKLTAYGLHRYKLERMAREIVANCHILRLPALFGKNIKKNFIYDLIHFFPAMLNKANYERFSAIEPVIAGCYTLRENGFYQMTAADGQKPELRAAFERLNFSALNFTDSRSVFQFYNLAYLWEHIETALANNIPLLHLAVEPLSAGEVYRELTGKEFINEAAAAPFNYDFRTVYANCFGGSGGYIFNRSQVLSDLKDFIGSTQ
jgi:nucleoside-diphosphate-sugar epimerase